MSDLGATAELLASAFPGSRVANEEYLGWLYDRSPFGPVIEANLDDPRGRMGHYAVVPAPLEVEGRAVSGAISLNTAVDERARGEGVFTDLAERAYADASGRGVQVIIGVANANSTPGFVGRLRFESLGPLPVSMWVTVPAQPAGWRTAEAGSAEADAMIDQAAPEIGSRGSGLERNWDPETLRWRLAAPGGTYLVHRGPGVLAVSTAARRGPLTVGVVLAVFASSTLPRRSCRQIRRTVAAAHKTPIGLHAGINERVALGGWPVPKRLRPSPLTLIVRTLETTGTPPASRFEFLDFDAY